jgi:hypothetical protein
MRQLAAAALPRLRRRRRWRRRRSRPRRRSWPRLRLPRAPARAHTHATLSQSSAGQQGCATGTWSSGVQSSPVAPTARRTTCRYTPAGTDASTLVSADHHWPGRAPRVNCPPASAFHCSRRGALGARWLAMRRPTRGLRWRAPAPAARYYGSAHDSLSLRARIVAELATAMLPSAPRKTSHAVASGGVDSRATGQDAGQSAEEPRST